MNGLCLGGCKRRGTEGGRATRQWCISYQPSMKYWVIHPAKTRELKAHLISPAKAPEKISPRSYPHSYEVCLQHTIWRHSLTQRFTRGWDELCSWHIDQDTEHHKTLLLLVLGGLGGV